MIDSKYLEKNSGRIENILSLFNQNKKCSEIVKELGISKKTVIKALASVGINYTEELKKERDWKIKQIPILYEEGKSQVELEKELQLTRKTIREVLKNSNVVYRSESEAKTLGRGHYINNNAFDDLTDPETLYWIGFIYTDGHVTIDNNRGQNSIEINIQSQDKELLEKLKIFLKCNYNIKEDPKYGCVKLRVFSEKLCGVLKSLGFTSNKTSNLDPHEKLKYSRDFWRGCVDGDGCLSYCKHHNNWIINLVGTIDTCIGFRDFITNNNIGGVRNVNKANGKNLFTTRYAGKIVKQVSDLLYKDAIVYLDRKYKKYLEIQAIL